MVERRRAAEHRLALPRLVHRSRRRHLSRAARNSRTLCLQAATIFVFCPIDSRGAFLFAAAECKRGRPISLHVSQRSRWEAARRRLRASSTTISRRISGETNANLSLNFQQQEEAAAAADGRRTPRSRSGTPSRRHRDRSATPSRRHKSKSREGSRAATPADEPATAGATLQPEAATAAASSTRRSSKTAVETMDVDQQQLSGWRATRHEAASVGVAATKRKKSDTGLPPAPKKERSRSKSPAVKRGEDPTKKPPVVTQPLSTQASRSARQTCVPRSVRTSEGDRRRHRAT